MSKSYFKKSHLHKPEKGKGSYDRMREEECIHADLVAEYDLSTYQSAHRAIVRQQEGHEDD